MSDQYNDSLGVCNVKIMKIFNGGKTGLIFVNFQLAASSFKRFELFFSKMIKLEEKESPDPKLSDFEWFGEVFKIIMFNMFVWFYHIFLISDLNTCLDFDVWPCKSKLRTSSTRIWSHFATRGPTRHLNTAKTCPKIADVGNFRTRFCHIWVFYRPPSGKMTSYSCRGGPKLWFAWSYIKIRQVLRSEMRKM